MSVLSCAAVDDWERYLWRNEEVEDLRFMLDDAEDLCGDLSSDVKVRRQ